MQKIERRKKYKDRSPKETITYIKGLLDKYGIKVTEEKHHIDIGDINSCRVYISNPGLEKLRIGTNGKGMNEEYSLASAYGEFMERLANNFLLPEVITNDDNTFYMNTKDAEPYIKEYCKTVFGDNEVVSDYYLKTITEDKVLFQKFIDVFSNTEVPMPISLIEYLVGSNGMCAGNNREEAIIQGISEIFERKAVYEIMVQNVIPPEIDKKYFEGTVVYKRIEELEKEGYRCRILDCSMNKDLPVIGLIVYHNGKYRTRFGSDPSPITSLERCFTEIFQGHDNLNDYIFKSIDKQELDFKTFTGTNKEYWFKQYCVEICCGEGYFPSALILEKEKPDYEFKGFKHPVSISNEDDLEYYYEIIKHNNKKLYISDRSSLGFPAYFTLIPSYSEYMIKEDCGRFFVERRECMNELKNLSRIYSLNKDELIKLAINLERWEEKHNNSKTGSSEFYDFCDIEIMHNYKVISYLYACAGDKENAKKYLKKYFETYQGQNDKQLFVRKNVEEPSLEKCFPKDEWPICPDCDNCGMKKKCHLDDIKRLNEKIIDVVKKDKEDK